MSVILVAVNLNPVFLKSLKRRRKKTKVNTTKEVYENESKNARGVLRGSCVVRGGCGRGKGRENCSRVIREEQNRLF